MIAINNFIFLVAGIDDLTYLGLLEWLIELLAVMPVWVLWTVPALMVAIVGVEITYTFLKDVNWSQIYLNFETFMAGLRHKYDKLQDKLFHNQPIHHEPIQGEVPIHHPPVHQPVLKEIPQLTQHEISKGETIHQDHHHHYNNSPDITNPSDGGGINPLYPIITIIIIIAPTLLSILGKRLLGPIADKLKPIWNILKPIFGPIWKWIQKLLQPIFNWLGNWIYYIYFGLIFCFILFPTQFIRFSLNMFWFGLKIIFGWYLFKFLFSSLFKKQRS